MEKAPGRGGLAEAGCRQEVRKMAMVEELVVKEVHRLEPELGQVGHKLDVVEVRRLEVVRVPVVRKLGVAEEDRTGA